MKRMKAIVVAVLALAMVAALCACGNKGGDTPQGSGAADGGAAKGMTYTLIYGNNEGDEVALVAQSLKDQWEEAFKGGADRHTADRNRICVLRSEHDRRFRIADLSL